MFSLKGKRNKPQQGDIHLILFYHKLGFGDQGFWLKPGMSGSSTNTHLESQVPGISMLSDPRRGLASDLTEFHSSVLLGEPPALKQQRER